MSYVTHKNLWLQICNLHVCKPIQLCILLMHSCVYVQYMWVHTWRHVTLIIKLGRILKPTNLGIRKEQHERIVMMMIIKMMMVMMMTMMIMIMMMVLMMMIWRVGRGGRGVGGSLIDWLATFN